MVARRAILLAMPTGPIGQKRPRLNKAVKMWPAMAAGVSKMLWSMDNIVALIDAATPKTSPRGPYKKREFAQV